MSSMTFFILFICIVAALFLVINLLLAPHNPYQEKLSAFECGFHSYLQTRLPFNISFFIFGLLFLILDLEILLLYPFAVSTYVNNVYGLIVMLIFSIILTIGFVFEIGRGALKIESRQSNELPKTYNNHIDLIANTTGRLNSNKVNNFTVKRHYSTFPTNLGVNKGLKIVDKIKGNPSDRGGKR